MATGEKVRKEFVSEKSARLDAFLSESVEGLSKRKAKEMCRAGLVRVNKRKATPATMVAPGDTISLPLEHQDNVAEAEGQQKFEVVYEDEWLACVFKPRCMHTVRLRPTDPITLADCIIKKWPTSATASPDVQEAGLLQRLDFYTSGIVLAAKNRESWEVLRGTLRDPSLKKEYYALVEGAFSGGERTVAEPLLVDKRKKVKVAKADDPRKPIATTGIEPVLTYRSVLLNEDLSIVLASGAAMVRHQVRVHLSTIGYPLVGDTLYGSKHSGFPAPENTDEKLRDGFLLHAQSITFHHPFLKKEMRLERESVEIEAIRRRAKK